MSGNHYHFGDRVSIHGGTHHTGIVKHPAPAPGPELRAAIEALMVELQHLRAAVPPPAARTIDESLPALAPDAAVEPQARRRALLAVAGVAATAGAVGAPIVELVNGVLQLLGVR